MGPRNVYAVFRNGWRGRMRAAPLRPQAGLPSGREACEGCAEITGRGARMGCDAGTSGGLLWRRETCEGRADMGGEDACGLRDWGLGWDSPWSHET